MPKAALLQASFRGGELSPLCQGRVDLPVYKTMVSLSLNMFPLTGGALTSRPGSQYIGTVSDQTKAVRLIPFTPAFGSQCMIEMGAGYFRFWQGFTPVIVGSTLANSYNQGQLKEVRFTQFGSTIFFFHPLHPTRVLTDVAGNGYPDTIVNLFGVDGPYLDSNWNPLTQTAVTSTTLTLGAVSGTGVTLVASATAGINGGSGFLTSDTGRIVRINTGAVTGTGTSGSPTSWTWLWITGYVSATQQLVSVLGNNALNTNPTLDWRLGVYTTGSNYPAWGAVHEGRLFVGGSYSSPSRIDASSLSASDITVNPANPSFTPSSSDGTVADDNALSYTLLAANAQRLLWGIPDERGILVGGGTCEWTVRPDTLSGSLTPTNVNAKPVTFYGSNAYVQPIQIGKSTIFVERFGGKLREMLFDLYTNGYKSHNRTLFADHITINGGIVDMAVTREPQQTLWCVRADGYLVAMTHEEEEGVITTGWSTHRLGGSFGGNLGGVVETVAVIPGGAASSIDEVWVVVKRTINGATARYIERITAPFDLEDSVSDIDIAFSDSWKHTTPTNPVTVAHLKAETVTVNEGGYPAGTFLVDATTGQFTLPATTPVPSDIMVGLPYNRDIMLLRPEAGAADGTALGKLRRIHRVSLLLQQSLSYFIGNSFTNLTYRDLRTSADAISSPLPPFSGIREEEIDMDYNYDNQLCIRVNDPTPFTLLAVTLRMDTQDSE